MVNVDRVRAAAGQSGDDTLEHFERSRAALTGLAYRMLGSLGEAEDVVQDAWVKLARARPGGRAPGSGYLLRTVSTLCLDRLRRLRRERRAYVGPWLPEPLIEAAPADPDGWTAAPVADRGLLRLGLLRLLEQLTPAERIVFVLREALDLEHREIAAALDLSIDASRQRHARARRKLAGGAAGAGAGTVDPAGSGALPRPLIEAFETALREGRVERLVALLADDAVLLTDGGGVVSAARVPVLEPLRIATVLVHVTGLALAAGVGLRHVRVNGAPGWLLAGPDGPHACATLSGGADRIDEILIVRNPHKLARLPPADGPGPAAI